MTSILSSGSNADRRQSNGMEHTCPTPSAPRSGRPARRFEHSWLDHTPSIRIALVESDPLRLIGFCALFDSKPGFELRAATVAEVLADKDIDVVLLATPGRQALFDRIVQLASAGPDLHILATGAALKDRASILDAIALGARGCVDETASRAEFVAAVRVVNQGLVWTPRRADSAVDFLPSRSVPPSAACRLKVTDREKQIIQVLLLGGTNKEIAAALGITERTVKGHLTRLMCKTGVRNRVELSTYAINRLRIPHDGRM